VSFVDTYGSDESDVDTAVYNMLSIEQVMVKNLVSVSSTQTIKEVTEVLAKNEFHALPVVDNGKLVGIVTTTDLLNYLLEQY
jgi:CBS domain-containing protein